MDAILIDLDEAAAAMATTPRRLSRLTRAGIVPSVDLGDGELRFSRETLREWVKARSQTNRYGAAGRSGEVIQHG